MLATISQSKQDSKRTQANVNRNRGVGCIVLAKLCGDVLTCKGLQPGGIDARAVVGLLLVARIGKFLKFAFAHLV